MKNSLSLAASIVIPSLNAVKTLPLCLRSLLVEQSICFEVLVVDDASEDGTWDYVSGLAEPRLRRFRTERRVGAAACRNLGIREARGPLIFFVDADCVADPGWLQNGIRSFEEPSVVAVEGAVYYANASPSLRDKVPINPLYNLDSLSPLNQPSSDYAAGNIAYRSRILRSEGGFDDSNFVRGREDTDLAIRAKRHGKIVFCPSMKVVHSVGEWDFSSLMRNARRYADDVIFYQKHGDFNHRWGCVLHPKLLAMLLLPPVFLVWALRHARHRSDLSMLYPLYVYLAAARLHIWRSAWQNRVLVI